MERISDKWWINFNGGSAIVSGKEIDSSYLVKWFCDDEFIGEFELGSNNWGSFNLRLGIWRIEFWQNGRKVDEYINELSNNDILIIVDFNSTPGKNLPINNLLDRGNYIKQRFNCNVVFYFKGSEKYDLSPFKTLKMNDKYDFKLILEEKYG
jgi:hypothetical protein|tara:strand:- start:361 stop:816 length:456 start_codon:yes stop_codon:yes gene_type:complete